MGRRGWAGEPPEDDEQARARILQAAVQRIAQHGADAATVADIAGDLGVTRKTIYRYFASAEDLFSAVAETAADAWTDQLAQATRSITQPQELLIETVAFIVEQLPRDEVLTLLLVKGHLDTFGAQLLQPSSTARARAILLSHQVDWASWGYDEATLVEMTEFLMRVIHSLLLVPRPELVGARLRRYLWRWVGPALVASAADPVAARAVAAESAVAVPS